MNHISRAIDELHAMDREARGGGWLHRLHPLAKLIVTLAYLIVLVSFPKYHLAGVLLMAVYSVVLCILGNVAVGLMWRRMWIVFLLVSLVGLPNPFFDHTPMFMVGGVMITGGMVSMLTLMFKACLAISAAYLLMLTTTMEDVCHVLRMIHVPAALVTVLMLIYRYTMVFLQEVERMTQAYALRAPGQRGVQWRVWGSMIGQLLLRSIDKAETVYASMMLRGFQGEFPITVESSLNKADFIYSIGWIVFFIVVRIL